MSQLARLRSSLNLIVISMATLLLAGCGNNGIMPVSTGSLMGGGSSFAYPIMNKWTSDYYKKTGAQVNYQSLGSSGGVKQFCVKTLDFGATDAPMNDEQLAAAKDEVLHIPVVMGAVAVSYNLPGIKQPVVFSGHVLADIYMGKIKKWNDPQIAKINPGVALPDADIVTVRRADGSGTTFIFADFLAKSSPEWEKIVGVGNALEWPGNSIGGKGNEGVSAQVKRSKNSIGYVELIYAMEAKMPVASIINQAGNAISPSVESVTAAAAELTTVPEDLRMSITNAPGEKAYPLAGLTWIVARKSMDSATKAKALKDFLLYVLSDKAQARADEAHYSKLPPLLLEPARAKAAQISGKN